MQSGLHIINHIKTRVSFTAIGLVALLAVFGFSFGIMPIVSPASALEPTTSSSGTPISSGLDLELSIEPVLQVIIPSDTLVLNLTPNPDPNTPVFTNKIMTVSVATNNPTGYSLMLNANSTNLTNTVADNEGNYALLPTLTDLEGGYSVESFTTNTWGYRYYSTILNNEATTTELGNYNAFTTNTELLSSKLPTNLDQAELDFGAKVDITQPAGSYVLDLNFMAITNIIPGVVTISFNGNGADNPTAMSPQQIEAGTSQTLNPNTFTKENYVFTGWNTKPDGTGTHYDNEAEYTTTLNVTNSSVVLYAEWGLRMQNLAAATCTTAPTQVVDERDLTVYYIQRLEDGNCWMMENLSLGANEEIALTPNDTNIANNYTLPASTTNGFANDASGRTIARINIDSRDMEDEYGNKYGTYYNFCATSAEQICMDSNDSGLSAVQDICPAGWRIPTGGGSGEIQTLATVYGISSNAAGATELQKILKVPLSGYFYDSFARNQGIAGYLWSSTYYSNTYMHYLYFGASHVSPQAYSYRYYGHPLRCLLKEPLNSITYMQDVTSDIVNRAVEGAKTTLIDKRDNKVYTVAKINGNLWMTKNLDLAGGTTLTSELSNVTSNYTLPTSSSSGFSSDTTAYVYNSVNNTCGSSSPCYSYYSYTAATAGTGGNLTSSNAPSDICPKGWKLPEQSEMGSLADIYPMGKDMAAIPFNGTYAGFYDIGEFYGGGSLGYYWSSTAYNTYFYAYQLRFSENELSNIIYNGKRGGFPVRCVVK